MVRSLIITVNSLSFNPCSHPNTGKAIVSSKLTQQGIKFFKAGSKHKAQLVFKEAIKVNPSDEIAWFWLAATYAKPANQIKCLNKVLSINPQNQAAQKQLARLQGKQHHPTRDIDQPESPPASIPPSISESTAVEEQVPPAGARNNSSGKMILRLGLAGLAIAAFVGLGGIFLFSQDTAFLSQISSFFDLQSATPSLSQPQQDIASSAENAISTDPITLPLSITNDPGSIRTPVPVQTRVLSIPSSPSLAADFACLPQNTERVVAKVIRVIDGDTIDIEYNGKQYSVRYIGIDTPETGMGSKPREYYSQEATQRNVDLVKDKSVTLVKDISNTDQYGRLLRYVLVDDIFVNHALVNEGFAHAVTFPPDIACVDLFNAAQESARLNNKGLWKNIPLSALSPTPFPNTPTPKIAAECPFGCKQKVPGCEIKGNINNQGEKIYHLPGSEWYDGTIINASSGERWFCTTKEAENNGWRPAK